MQDLDPSQIIADGKATTPHILSYCPCLTLPDALSHHRAGMHWAALHAVFSEARCCSYPLSLPQWEQRFGCLRLSSCTYTPDVVDVINTIAYIYKAKRYCKPSACYGSNRVAAGDHRTLGQWCKLRFGSLKSVILQTLYVVECVMMRP